MISLGSICVPNVLAKTAAIPPPVDVAQRPVDRKTEVLVSPGQGQGVGFERQIIVRKPELRRVLGPAREVGENRPVGEIGGDAAVFQHLDPIVMGLGGDDFRADVPVSERVAQAPLGGRAGEHPDFLAGKFGEAARSFAFDQQARPVDEGGDREVHLPPSREGFGRRLAEEISLAGRNDVETGLRRHRNELDLQIGEVELGGEIGRHRAAKIDHEACRIAVGVLVGKRRSVGAHREAKRLRLANRIEHAGRGGA